MDLKAGSRNQVGTSPERTVTTAADGSLPMFSLAGLGETFWAGMLRLLDAFNGKEQALENLVARY